MKALIIAFLQSLGWKDDHFYKGDALSDPYGDWLVTVDDAGWELARFDDSDNPHTGQAEGRWVKEEEGETLAELRDALAAEGVAR